MKDFTDQTAGSVSLITIFCTDSTKPRAIASIYYKRRMTSAQLFVVALVVAGAKCLEIQRQLFLPEKCSIDVYYDYYLAEIGSTGSLDTLTGLPRSDLSRILSASHGQVLPYTSSSRSDVWDALIDLDGNDDNSMVKLVYTNQFVPAEPYGTATTWNREHLWPKSHGVGFNGPDFTDVHALRPSDWNVNAVRNNLYFGDCATSDSAEANELPGTCTRIPAAPEAANDTARDGDQFLPPVSVRGDIARALFYMELRYSGNDSSGDTLDLVLTDCPVYSTTDTDANNQMAYLSQLLEWHAQDPVDDAERTRNEKVCKNWQGNRNIFVDFPKLVELLHRQPKSRPYQCNTTATATNGEQTDETDNVGSEESDLGDTADSSQKTCSGLKAGDVQFIGMSADNPDSFMLVTLVSLRPGLKLYVTDNGWLGNEFTDNEGTVVFSIPFNTSNEGWLIGYEQSSNLWQSVGSASFALSTSGESLTVYCERDDGSKNTLGALISGKWLTNSDTTNLSTSDSLLPSALNSKGAVQIPTKQDNLVYQGIVTGRKDELIEAINNPDNWIGSNTDKLEYGGHHFTVVSETSSATACSWTSMMVCLTSLFYFFHTL